MSGERMRKRRRTNSFVPVNEIQEKVEESTNEEQLSYKNPYDIHRFYAEEEIQRYNVHGSINEALQDQSPTVMASRRHTAHPSHEPPQAHEFSGSRRVSGSKAGLSSIAEQHQGPSVHSSNTHTTDHVSVEVEHEHEQELIPETHIWLWSRGVSVLGRMAHQILELFAGSASNELYPLVYGGGSWLQRTWTKLCSLFESSCEFYELRAPRNGVFPDIDRFIMLSDEQKSDLLKINLAIAICILCKTPDSKFLALHDRYFQLFTPVAPRMTDWQIKLFTAIKLHCFVSDFGPRNILTDEEYRNTVRKSLLKQPELDGIDRLQSHETRTLLDVLDCIHDDANERVDSRLQAQPTFLDSFQEILPSLKDFVKNVFNLQDLSQNLEDCDVQRSQNKEPVFHDYVESAGIKGAFNHNDNSSIDGVASGYDKEQDEMVRRAALAAHAALMGQHFTDGYETTVSRSETSASPQQMGAEIQSVSSHQAHQEGKAETQSPEVEEGVLTAENISTREQYEKARQAASAKTAAKLKASLQSQSQRRAWTSEEENALMTGLDRVHGPHWSQILAMYGSGGTVSEILKDRNQVQLKDKARNLKLYFLKNGHDVPHYLKQVTGELKTRAPVTAAKRDARLRLQDSAGEDRAAADAISLLAGGRSSFSPSLSTQEFDRARNMVQELSKQGHQDISQSAEEDDDDDEENADEHNANDEMVASAIQQALAVSRATNGSDKPG